MSQASNSTAGGLRLAIVTGGASGIGRGIARDLARNHYRVAIVDKDDALAQETAALIRDEGYKAKSYCGDITSYDATVRLVDALVTDQGTPWLLVNNVGGDSPKPFLETAPQDWERLINLNVKTVLNMTHKILPYMVKAGGGRVVNISSDSARVGIPGVSVYATCKGGVISFSKCIAKEMAIHNILVNTVCPGITMTPAVEKVLAAGGGKEWANNIVGQIPLGRMGTPEDTAAMVVFLAGPGGDYLTGQTYSVSGGKSMV